jgi:hypothetical protein
MRPSQKAPRCVLDGRTPQLHVLLRHRLRGISRMTTVAEQALARFPSLHTEGTARGDHLYRPDASPPSHRRRRRAGLEECAASRAAHRGSPQGASARPVDSRPGRGSRRFLRVQPLSPPSSRITPAPAYPQDDVSTAVSASQLFTAPWGAHPGREQEKPPGSGPDTPPRPPLCGRIVIPGVGTCVASPRHPG